MGIPIRSARERLLDETTIPEFYLAQHVELATQAKHDRDAGHLDLARSIARISRDCLRQYREAKAADDRGEAVLFADYLRARTGGAK